MEMFNHLLPKNLFYAENCEENDPIVKEKRETFNKNSKTEFTTEKFSFWKEVVFKEVLKSHL